MTNPGVIDLDYREEVKVVLANLGDEQYRVIKGDRIAQLIIEKIDNRELQEVTQLDDTKSGELLQSFLLRVILAAGNR